MADSPSGRKSSRLHQKSGAAQPSHGTDEEADSIATEFLAWTFYSVRQNRDDTAGKLERDINLFENADEGEPNVKEVVTNRMSKIDTSVSTLETTVTGSQLESLLRDPQYGSPVRSKPASPAKSRISIDPIEIKVEEPSAAHTPCSSTGGTNMLTVNTAVAPSIGPDTVEKAAKQEAHTMARISELRRSGLWSSSRLPLCVEPPRNKTHWDYVLEEVKWMATDFRTERKWKSAAAKKLATTIARQAREKEMEIEKQQHRAVKDQKRYCATIAKMIRDFWQNVDKVVDHRKQTIIEGKKRKALDQHLQFIVGEADKLSQVVAEGIVVDNGSKAPSVVGKDEDKDDKDFSGVESESDDETTIAKAEKGLKDEDVKGEVDALGNEADMGFDDFMDSLPPEYLASLGLGPAAASTSKSVKEEGSEEDKEDEEEEDDSDETDEDDEEEEDRPSTSKQSAHQKTAKKEKSDDDGDEADSDDEPLVKRIRRSSRRGGNKDAMEVDSDDEPLADKIRRSKSLEASNATSEETTERESGGQGEEETRDSQESQSQPPSGRSEEKVKLDGVDFTKLNSDNSDERQLELTHIAEEALKFQPKGYTLETTQVKTAVPPLIRGTLREYQMVGLDWLVTLYDKNLNGILADEMGLGKTIQTVALLAHLACVERVWGPHLIVVPTSVILNWEMELKKWCPALKVLTYFGSVKERAEKRKGWLKPNSFHVCVTSYKVVTQDIRSFKMRSWQYLILDEAQNIKNWKSQRWQTLLNVRARRRLLLTGTPLQNSLMELWSLLHFLMPAIFASHDDFKDWFSNPLTGMMEGSVEFNKGLLDRLHKVLRPFILRRMKAEVEKQMPSKTEHVVKCPLSKRQRYLYEDFMSQRQTRENLKSGNMMSVLNIVMQLRKCCNHPNLFTPREEQTPFVTPPITRVLPAIVYDIVTDDPLQEQPTIPECLYIKQAGWTTQVTGKKPLVEDLDDPTPLPPKVDGFRFVKPVVQRAHPTAPPTSAPPPGEMFLVVDSKNDIGGLLKDRVQVTVDGDRVVLNRDGKVLTGAEQKLRVCQAVAGGSFRDVSVDPTTGVARRASGVGWKGAPQPPMALRESGATPSVSATSIESRRSSASVYARDRRPAVIPTIRATTMLYPQKDEPGSRPNGEHPSTATDGDEKPLRGFGMDEGALEPYDAFPLPLSPPLKKRRVERPIVVGPYKELVPPDIIARMEEERDERLNKALARFSDPARPMFSWQLMSLLWRETRTRKVPQTEEEKQKEKDKWNNVYWRAEREDVRTMQRETAEMMTKRFVIYVDGAIAAHAPTVVPLSRGRTAYARESMKQLELVARKQLTACDPLVDATLLAHNMQFPELRLIEYDCGKLQVMAKLLRELFVYKHRCLIFTQMSRMLDVLQAFLSHHGYQYFRLDGTTPIEQRQAMMERFNADNRIFCFILSTRSGGVGVNLTGADTVIFYDSDWNPTMDAQAQDRCHRIGQTRNVSIYRLISERTIEENILKKAMQKRRLGEMAIDEAGFTPDFFKQKDNIRDLFEGEEGMDDIEVEAPPDAPTDQRELDNAMASLEDEQDVAAAKIVAREANADRNEFDERMAAGGSIVKRSATSPDDPADEQYVELLGQLKPIERYAIEFLEAEYKPDFDEEVKEAEALIVQKKAEWNRAHERAMREEEGVEGGGGMGDDDPFLSAGMPPFIDELWADFDIVFQDELLPTWRPPTPPLSDGDDDLYVNEMYDGLYEQDITPECRLPGQIYDLHRPLSKYALSPTKKQQEHSAVLQLLNAASPLIAASQGRGASPLPESLRNSPLAAALMQDNGSMPDSASIRRASQTQKKSQRSLFEGGSSRTPRGDLRRPTTPPPAEREAKDYEGPEWTIIEDYALLRAVLNEQRLTHGLGTGTNGQPPMVRAGLKLNWEYISGFVNRVSGNYRSPRQCSVHFQLVVLPREEGKMMTIDPLTRKPRKLALSTSEIVHLRKGRTSTLQQYNCDASLIMKDKTLDHFSVIRRLREKREPPFKREPVADAPVWSGVMPPSHVERFTELAASACQYTTPDELIKYREEKRVAHEQASSGPPSAMRPKQETAAGAEDKAKVSTTRPIVVRSSAIGFQPGTLVTPAQILLEMPVIARSYFPPGSTSQPASGGPGGGGGGREAGGPGAHHPVAEHLPAISGLPRRIPGGIPAGSHVIMGSNAQSGSGSLFVVQQGDGQPSRMQAVLARGDSGTTTLYRSLPSGGQKRATPGGAPLNATRMGFVSSGDGSGTGAPVVVRGTAVSRGGDLRGTSVGGGGAPGAPRMTARPALGGQPGRMYVASSSQQGAGSPSAGGGEGGATRTAYMHVPQSIRVGVAGTGGGATVRPAGVPAPKRAHSVLPPNKPPGPGGPIMLSRQGPLQHGRPQVTRFPASGGNGVSGNVQPRMMNVLMRGDVSTGVVQRVAAQQYAGQQQSSSTGITRQIMATRQPMMAARVASPSAAGAAGAASAAATSTASTPFISSASAPSLQTMQDNQSTPPVLQPAEPQSNAPTPPPPSSSLPRPPPQVPPSRTAAGGGGSPAAAAAPAAPPPQ